MTFSFFSPLRTFRNATGETSKSPKAGHCSDQSQKTPTAITTDPPPSARAVARATQITPRSPPITNKLLQITPESPQITPRSPQITRKAAPDHARDAADQATPDHARVAADHSHTRAQATQATDDGRRRCAVGGAPSAHGPRARLHGRKGVHSTIVGFSLSPRLSMFWASTTLEGEPAATLTVPMTFVVK